MSGRIFIALLAVLAVLPAGASAANSPELTYPTGTKLATGNAFRGVNVGSAIFTSTSGNTTCSSGKLTGKLTVNSGTAIEGDIESVALSGGLCTVNTAPTENGVPWCLRSTAEFTEDEFQIRGGQCTSSAQPIRIKVNTTTLVNVECVYERSAAISGTYKTHPEDALLSMSSVKYTLASGAGSCIGTTELDTSLTLEKDEAATSPLYLSSGPQLTYPTGVRLATGNKVKGHNVGEIKITSALGTLSCTAAAVTGTLKKNNGTEIETDIESASFSGTGSEERCTGSNFFTPSTKWTFATASNGLPWCLRATSKMAADEFQIRGNNCASTARPIQFITEFTASVEHECTYERVAPLTGTFTTHPEDAVLTLTHSTFLEVEPKSGECPDETQLDSSMTLEANEAGIHPMYIS